MADLRFSNQGPIVLGLGGTYPNYASIPTVFGGPTQGILISVYNRGGAYVPNTIYNQAVPTTIGVGSQVDFSDYYTSSNYVTGPIPPAVPNPRPVNNPNPEEFYDLYIIPEIIAPQSGYIGNTVTLGSVVTKGPKSGLYPFECASVTIDGITTPNVASDPTNIEFVIQGGMNYDPANRSDVLINAVTNYEPLVIPKWFARYTINYNLYGTLSNTMAMAGQNVLISNILSLQTNPQPTITIGGITQTIVSITPHDSIQNDIMFTVNANTPLENSNIVIRNSKGDSVTLPQQFRRLNPVNPEIPPENPSDPIDRGGPPVINWEANEQIPESLIFTFSSTLSYANGSTYLQNPTYVVPPTNQNQTTFANDPSNGYGNQLPLPSDSDFQLQSIPSPSFGNTFVPVGSLTSALTLPPTAANTTVTLTYTFSSSYTHGIASTSGGAGAYVANVGGNTSFSTSFGTIIIPNAGNPVSITEIGSGIYQASIQVRTGSTPTTFDVTLAAPGAQVYLDVGTHTSFPYSYIKFDGTTVRFDSNRTYWNTYKNYALITKKSGWNVNISTVQIQFYLIVDSAKVIDPVSGIPSYFAIWAVYWNNFGTDVYRYVGAFTSLNETVTTGQLPFYYANSSPNISLQQLQIPNPPPASISVNSINRWYVPTIRSDSVPTLQINSSISQGGYVNTATLNNNTYVSFFAALINISNKTMYSTNSTAFGTNYDPPANFNSYVYSKFYTWNGTIIYIPPYVTTPHFRNVFDISTTPPTSVNILSTINYRVLTLNITDSRMVGAFEFVGDSFYLNSNSFTGTRVTNSIFSYFLSSIFPIIEGDPDYGYYVSRGDLTPTRTYITNPFLGFPPVVTWTFNRQASATYTALNLLIQLPSTSTNQQRAQSLGNLLVSQWNGPNTPTFTITTDAGGNTILTFNTNNTMPSNSTLMLATGVTIGSLTLTTAGGSTGTNDNISRLQINGAPAGGPVYIDSSYGYINNLTFTHTATAFNNSSAVIPNVNQPSSIRDIINTI